jgi:hypothetical protein
MSASELAEHLRETCGDPDRWRDDPEEAKAAGTELYEFDGAGGTEQIDLAEVSEAILSDSDVFSMAVDGSELHSLKSRASKRGKTSITRLTELKGIQLTSMINMAASDQLGASPLVDWDDLAANPHVAPAAVAEVPPLAEDSRIVTAAALRASAVASSAGDRGRDDSTGVVVGRGESRPSRPPSARPVPVAAAPRPTPRPSRGLPLPRGRGPWIVLGLIVVVGVVVALVIAMSGPSLDGAAPPRAPRPVAPASAP